MLNNVNSLIYADRALAPKNGNISSKTITLRTGLHKAACSALRSSPCWHTTVPTYSTNRIMMRKEASMPVQWHKDNNLLLNAEKTKDVERVSSTYWVPAGRLILADCCVVWRQRCPPRPPHRRKTLQHTVSTAGELIGAPLPSLADIFQTRLTRRAKSSGCVTPPTPFTPTSVSCRQGKRYRSLRARSTRLLSSFIHQDVRMLSAAHCLICFGT